MSWPLIAALIMFVLMFLLRMPIPLGMISVGIVYFLLKGLNPGILSGQIMSMLYSKYVLIAVPLFIFSATVMNDGKITEYIFKFANGLIGNKKGALGHVNIIASLIFSGMTGSAIADASGLGAMEIDIMRKNGYDEGFSGAITAASATIGPIFPPSIPMVTYAMLSGASVGALFIGGMIPGVLIAVALMVYVGIISRKRNYPAGEKAPLRDFLFFTFKAIPALLTPVILLGGIYTGWMTSTEAGAVAGLYAIVVSFLIYRTLGVKSLWKMIKSTVRQTGIVAMMVGASAAISYIVTRENVASTVAELVLQITQNKYVFLLAVNISFLILGMFINVTTIQLVFIPIILPLVEAFGINLVHFGVVIVLNMMIGLSTPPFGTLLFVTSGVGDIPLKKVIKEIRWPLVGMLAVLFLITYIPDIVMVLPQLLN